MLPLPVRIETESEELIDFQEQLASRVSLSLSNTLSFANFSHCDLGIMTCCFLDNNLDLSLTTGEKKKTPTE